MRHEVEEGSASHHHLETAVGVLGSDDWAVSCQVSILHCPSQRHQSLIPFEAFGEFFRQVLELSQVQGLEQLPYQ